RDHLGCVGAKSQAPRSTSLPVLETAGLRYISSSAIHLVFRCPSIRLLETLNDTARFRRRLSGTDATFWFICRAATAVFPDGVIRCYICTTAKMFSMQQLRFRAWSGVWTKQLNA